MPRLIDRLHVELSPEVGGAVRRLSDRTGIPLRRLVETALVEYLDRRQQELREPAAAKTAPEGADIHAS